MYTHTLYTAGQMSESTPCYRRIFWSPLLTFAFLYTASCVVVPHKRRAAKTSPRLTYVIRTCRYIVITDIKIILYPYIPMVVIIIIIIVMAYNNFLVMIDHISVGVFFLLLCFFGNLRTVLYIML